MGKDRSVTFHHAAVGACHVVTCHVGACHVGACHMEACHVVTCHVGALSFSNPRVSPVACVGHVGLGGGVGAC